MFDYSFIDLDDTLFNTHLFKKDIFGCFAKYGVNAEAFGISYKQAVFGPMIGYFDYTFKKHADILREMNYEIPDRIVDELEDLFKKNYNDFQAEQFLVDIKKVSGKMILLTAGEKNIQEKKIASTGLAKYFDAIEIIDGGKTQKILDIAGQDKKILFINDNLTENIQIKNDLSSVLIVAKKHRDKWDGDDYEKNNLPCFNTLNEIKDYVFRSL